MSVSDEVIMLGLAYIITYLFILNSGNNLNWFRRIIGAMIVAGLGTIALISLGTTNANNDINIIGLAIFGISIVFSMIQLGNVVLGKFKGVGDKD